MSDENAIELRRHQVSMTNTGVRLTSMDDAWRFCEAIAGTPIAPKGMDAKQIFGVIQAGAEMGLSPLRSLANMKIINGRVGPMGALAKALVRQAGVLKPGTGFKEWFDGTPGADDWTAHISTHRAGEEVPYETEFSVKDAKRAGLWGKAGPWAQYPKRMLRWRAIGFHMDDYYSDVLMGFHVAEVLPDYPPEREVVVMQPLATPSKDPLLDDLDAKYKADVAQIEKELQPPAEPDEPPLSADEIERAMERKVGKTISPLTDTIADMIQREAVSDEDLAAADPNNAQAEGEDAEELF